MKLDTNPVQTEQIPFVSMIIATKNEEKYIGKLLDSIVNQTYPKSKFEVLLIDGMSEDSSLDIVNQFKEHLDITILSNPKIRAPAAFNLGIDHAKGDLFFIIGAHSFLCDNFIQESVKTFFEVKQKEPMLAGVGGVCIDENETNSGKIVSLLYSSAFSGARSCRYNKNPHFSDTVIFGLFDKQIIVENGKFNEDFLAAGDDDELTIRLCNKGYKFFTNPEIESHYFTRKSFSKFLKQTFNYGVAKGLMVRKGSYRLELFNSASLWFFPASFLFYEILAVFLLILGLSPILVIFPFFIYWVVNIGVSIQLFGKTKSGLCVFLPFTYFVFHNILGVSSLMGLILKSKAFL